MEFRSGCVMLVGLFAMSMKLSAAIACLLLGSAVVAIAIAVGTRRPQLQEDRDPTYANLKGLASFSHDFSTPEGAILCLEDAYRRRDIEAALAAKDFVSEARHMLEESRIKTQIDEELLTRAAEVLATSFRAEITAAWPNLQGVESYFPSREVVGGNVVRVTEVCRHPDGGYSRQQLLVAETPKGWRVMNPVK